MTRLLALAVLALPSAASAGDTTAAPDLRAGFEKLRWTDGKADVRRKYRRAEPQSEGGLRNVDMLSVRGFLAVGGGMALDASIYFEGSTDKSRVDRIVLRPVPSDFNMTDERLAAAWVFIANRLQLGELPPKDAKGLPRGGATVDVLRNPGDFGVVIHRPSGGAAR